MVLPPVLLQLKASPTMVHGSAKISMLRGQFVLLAELANLLVSSHKYTPILPLLFGSGLNWAIFVICLVICFVLSDGKSSFI
jgi:hypothetical protein